MKLVAQQEIERNFPNLIKGRNKQKPDSTGLINGVTLKGCFPIWNETRMSVTVNRFPSSSAEFFSASAEGREKKEVSFVDIQIQNVYRLIARF